ncbi:hypothetical protein [Paludisphaera rhizosphaerae]|uniref:hypothetical protein n=1 Tax=Paludisphaera rhizosphaerae TaxID=2711216 RepID=UPI0013EB005A|nr:hypothetical protein [Paludisphaera rhizosphaerae]
MKTRHVAPALVICLAALAGESPVRAQGFGWGGFAMPWVPTPTNFVNDWALQNAARAGRPPSNNVYANNPNSYINRLRDPGFTPTQDARGFSYGSRRAAEIAAAQAARSPGEVAAHGSSATTAPPPPPPAKPAQPVASFFDASGRLVWPAEAPTNGDLKAKRDVSDQAAAAVRREVDAQGWAPIALAAEARQKLLDYGRPALQEVRASSTPMIAQTFHEFLMSLYNAIGSATVPPPH